MKGNYNALARKKPCFPSIPRTLGVFAQLVLALVFKSTQGIFRLFRSGLEKHRKYLPFQVVTTENWSVDIVGDNAKKGLFSTSKG